MFTVAFNIVRKGIVELWTVTDVWSECMRQIHNAGGIEIVKWERI
jgi:hypothetical protein